MGKMLIFLLLLDAAAVFVMQLCRWKGVWLFVALYWALLTIKNLRDWRR